MRESLVRGMRNPYTHVHMRVWLRTYFPMMLLALALLVRAAELWLHPPMHHLYSDPLRHWMNGERFLTPDIMGSIDPIMYQLWIWGVRSFSGDAAWAANGSALLLSLALPLLWWGALREITTSRAAMLGAAAVGLAPSLIGIYSYFMNETLLMVCMAGGVWASLRAWRTGSGVAYVLAALVWAAACYTRFVTVPVAAVFLLAPLCMRTLRWHSRAWRAMVAASAMAALLPVACWHSSKNLGFCAPFGLLDVAEAYRTAQTFQVDLVVEGVGHWGFVSPALVNKPFAPLSNWQVPKTGIFPIYIYPELGRKSWTEALQGAHYWPKSFTPLEDKWLNLVLAFLDPSWPDNNTGYAVEWASVQLRWLWFPLTMLGCVWLGGALVARQASPRVMLLPCVGVGLMLLLAIQTGAITEGRYRKPAEPLLIVSLAVLWQERRARYRPPAHQTCHAENPA